MKHKTRLLTARAISLLLCMLMILFAVPTSVVAEMKEVETTTDDYEEPIVEPPLDAEQPPFYGSSSQQPSLGDSLTSNPQISQGGATNEGTRLANPTPVTNFSDGVYYIRTLYAGRLFSGSVSASGGYYSSTFTIGGHTSDTSDEWEIEWQQGGTYVIKALDYPDYGLVGNGSLYFEEISEEGYTDAFHWYFYSTGDGYLLKSYWTDEYLYYDGSQVSISSTLPSSTSDDYEKFLWDFAAVDDYVMLNNFEVNNSRWMAEDSMEYVAMTLFPSNASWSEYDETSGNDFLWTTTNRDVAYVEGGYLFTGDAGFATITAYHRLTQETYSFAITVGQVISSGPYFIKNAQNGKVVDVEGPSTADGAYIQQWTANPNALQMQWQISYLGSGYYSVRSLYSNKYLSVLNASTASGASIVQKTSLTDAGKWMIRRSDDGHFIFLPKSGAAQKLVLTVPSNSISDGTNLKQMSYQHIDGAFWDEWEINSAGKTAIVIIPGMMGSELRDGSEVVWIENEIVQGILGSLPFAYIFSSVNRMQLNENGESINNIWSFNSDNYGANNVYQTLYNELYAAYSHACDVIFFDYDFRLSNTVSAQKLQSELTPYNDVVLVAHSMGGLVAAKYLQMSEQNRIKTTALISLGTPYAGTTEAIDAIYTGNMIDHEFFWPIGEQYVLTPIIKEIGKNSFSAYQAFPTLKYYDLVGQYPLMVNGYSHSNVFQKLSNAPWGKKSDGSVKPMFDDALLFQQSLLIGSQHVIHHEDVTSYTIAGIGFDTIISLNLDVNYNYDVPLTSSNGDGSVMRASAGYGAPDYTYALDHMELIESTAVIARIKNLITQETGISAQATVNRSASQSSLKPEDDKLLNPEDIVVNEKGWVMGFDNRRINVIVDDSAQLRIDGQNVTERGNRLYNVNGDFVGNVWRVGETGKMYSLRSNDCEVINTSFAKIAYMNNGYYEKIVEYSEVEKDACFTIGNYDTKTIVCEMDAERTTLTIQPIRTYSDSELEELN